MACDWCHGTVQTWNIRYLIFPVMEEIVTTQPKVAIVCSTCGSDRVSRDAWADWDSRSQEWVLGSVFDAGFCHRCEGETRLTEVPLRDIETIVTS